MELREVFEVAALGGILGALLGMITAPVFLREMVAQPRRDVEELRKDLQDVPRRVEKLESRPPASSPTASSATNPSLSE